MARLSAENSSNPATPTNQPGRKSTFLKDLFKGGHSRSNLSQVATETSPYAPAPASPTTKPGYEQIGLLPSQRPLTGIVKKARDMVSTSPNVSPGESLAKQEQELKGVSVPHNVDTRLDAAAIKHTATDTPASPAVDTNPNKAVTPEHGESAGRTTTEEMHTEGEMGLRSRREERAQHFTVPLISRAEICDILVQQHEQAHNAGDLDETDLMQMVKVVGSESEPTVVRLAPGHSDDYINSNTALLPKLSAIDAEPSHEALANVPEVESEPLIKDLEKPNHFFIGPFNIHDDRLGSFIHLTITISYLAILFIAAFIGPAAFFLTVWRLALVFVTYAVARQHLGWSDREATDVVISPVERVIERVWYMILQGVHAGVKNVVRVAVAVMEDAEEGN